MRRQLRLERELKAATGYLNSLQESAEKMSSQILAAIDDVGGIVAFSGAFSMGRMQDNLYRARFEINRLQKRLAVTKRGWFFVFWNWVKVEYDDTVGCYYRSIIK
jgi:hypothetical protein